jgi:hypothetical protein
MSSLEMISILSKQWANVNDIKIIASCGRDKASLIRDDIINSILASGQKLPISKSKLVPMENVINYLNINIDYIYSMAKKEKNLI